MTKETLTVKERVLKFRNSKTRYIRITDNHFNTIKHGDTAEVLKDETDEYLDLIYRFKKTRISDPKKGKIGKITTSIKKGKK